MLDSEEAHHARRVLRLPAGAEIQITDGDGRVAECVLDVSGGRLRGRVLDVENHILPEPAVTVFQAALKAHKTDEVVIRLAELGVRDLWIFDSVRAVKRLDDARARRAVTRWSSQARAAGKQSRHPHFLRVHGILRWSELTARLGAVERPVLLWEEAAQRLRGVVAAPSPGYALVVGPEGGFSAVEAEEATAAGAAIAGLGPGILRAEHAAAVAAAIVLYQHGIIG